MTPWAFGPSLLVREVEDLIELVLVGNSVPDPKDLENRLKGLSTAEAILVLLDDALPLFLEVLELSLGVLLQGRHVPVDGPNFFEERLDVFFERPFGALLHDLQLMDLCFVSRADPRN